MNADKKSSGHIKQRRKSPCNVVVIHEVVQQNGGNNMPTSTPFTTSPKPNMNGLSVHPEINSPNLAIIDNVDGTKRKLSLNSEDRSDSNVSINGTSTPARRSHTESEISAHLQKSPMFALGDSDEVFVNPNNVYQSFNNDTGSLHRPVTIEEELFSKVNQINSLVHLWRKRWKQQKDYSDLLSKQLQAVEREYDQTVQSVKDIYSQKLKQARKDLGKEILEKQKIEREKSKLEMLYKKSTETHNSEYEKLHQTIKSKAEEAEVAQSLQNDARTTIKDLKKELSKVRRENEKLVRHIGKLRSRMTEVENSQPTNMDSQYCSGDCEHKLLFDLAIQRLKFYENSNELSYSIQERRTSKHDPVRKYVVMSDPDEPANVSIEKSCSQTIEGLNLDVCTSVNYINDHSKDSAVELSPTLDHTFENNNSKKQPDHYSGNRERTASSCSKDSILSHDASLEHKIGSRDSLTSDSALSTEGHPPSPHLVLRKSLTSDSVSNIGAHHKTRLARRTTWTHYEISPPDSGNCSPKNSPRDGSSESDIHASHSTTKLNAISGFEGLRERRNGIIDMDREVALQLKLGKSAKKSKDFSDMFKKFSFSGGTEHTSVRDKDIHGSEKKNFMNLNMSVFSRKKSNPVTD